MYDGSGNLLSSDLHYDAAGELTADPLFQYSYDAAGMVSALSGAATASYSYSADGERSAKTTGSGWTDYIYVNGQALAEHTSAGWTDYVNADGKKLVMLAGTAQPVYFVDDRLGTLNMELNASGAVQWQGDNTPFGQDIIAGGTNNAFGYHENGADTHYKFTGKERDAESGLDYFGARYYASGMGRWMSPDWSSKEEPVPYAKLDDPQSLNLYQYVGNNPLSRADADGHDAVRVVDKQTGQVTIIIPVKFKGKGATPERIQQIKDRVAGINTGDPNVHLELRDTKKKVDGVLNTLDLSPGPNTKMCGAAGSCVNKIGGNKGHSDSDAQGNNDPAPHEVIHFAGPKDRYEEQTGPNGERVTPPSPGYDTTNAMSSRSGTNLNADQLQEINNNKTTKHCTSSDGKTTCN